MKELLENQTSLLLIRVDLSMSSCANALIILSPFNAIRFNGRIYLTEKYVILSNLVFYPYV